MYIVTGGPRCGTSFVMQCLMAAGFQIYGYKNSFHENLRQFNEKGFYENNQLTREGINFQNTMYTPKFLQHTVLKVFGDALWNTDSKFIDKIVVCTRECNEAIKSWRKLMAVDDEISRQKIHKMYEGVKKTPEENYFSHFYSIIDNIVKRNLEFIVIDYEDWFKDAKETTAKLFNFFGFGRFDLAMDCVDPKMHHNKEVKVEVENKGILEYNNILRQQLRDGSIFTKDNLEALNLALNKINEKIKLKMQQGEKHGRRN